MFFNQKLILFPHLWKEKVIKQFSLKVFFMGIGWNHGTLSLKSHAYFCANSWSSYLISGVWMTRKKLNNQPINDHHLLKLTYDWLIFQEMTLEYMQWKTINGVLWLVGIRQMSKWKCNQTRLILVSANEPCPFPENAFWLVKSFSTQ